MLAQDPALWQVSVRDSGRRIRKRERGWIEEAYGEEIGQSGNSTGLFCHLTPALKKNMRRG